MRDLYLACPIIRGPGGIASYARALLDALAPDQVTVLGHGTSRQVAELPPHAQFLGSPATRGGFAARLVADYLGRPPTVFIFAHVGLTTPLAIVPRRRDHRVVVMGHGTEVWARLGPRQAASLPRLDSAVFTARYNRALFMARNGHRLSQSMTTAIIALSAARSVEAVPPAPVPNKPVKRLLCITRLVRDESLKGLPTLIAAVKHLPKDWELVIVGDGDARNDLARLAMQLGVSYRVHLTGWLSDEERARQLAEAEVFCLPSAQEGFGIVFLEAMAAGRPCVGAAAGAIPEVLPPEFGEIFPFEDEVALARAVLRASARLRSGEITPESIREQYETRYAWSHFRNGWLQHLATLR